MRNALTIAAAAVLLAGCASTGLHNPFSSSTGFSDLDTNGDGVISRREAQESPTLARNFNRIDTSADQNISSTEFTAATTFMSPQPSFQQYDLNGDGFITEQEASAVSSGGLINVFDQVDADGDGNISSAEFSAATINPLHGVSFSSVDTDNDGAIDRKEAGKVPLLAPNFDRIDVNGDGQISKSEYQSMQSR